MGILEIWVSELSSWGRMLGSGATCLTLQTWLLWAGTLLPLLSSTQPEHWLISASDPQTSPKPWPTQQEWIYLLQTNVWHCCTHATGWGCRAGPEWGTPSRSGEARGGAGPKQGKGSQQWAIRAVLIVNFSACRLQETNLYCFKTSCLHPWANRVSGPSGRSWCFRSWQTHSFCLMTHGVR